MKKTGFIVLILLVSQFHVFSQIRISGKVLTYKNIPLANAAVYLNNTSIGTSTNSDGDFSLLVDEGKFDLIVSYLGFETKSIHVNTKFYSQPLLIKLPPKANLLNEIVISSKRKKLSKRERAKYLSQFKRYFIGETNFSRRCKIKNPEVLDFKFNERTHTLTAYASEPIVMENQSLGYIVSYDLEHFKLTPQKVTSLGYSRYQNMEGTDKKKKLWKKNRASAYNGSLMHFVRSLRNNTANENGFKMSQIARKKNPKRPADSLIRMAEDYIDKYQRKGYTIPETGLITKPLNKLDSVIYILQKSHSEKRYIEVVLNRNVKAEDIIIKVADEVYLEFDDFLRVIYVQEKEEKRYAKMVNRSPNNFQESTLNLISGSVILDKSGAIIQPLDAVVQRYWSYLKFADKVPLDYSIDD